MSESQKTSEETRKELPASFIKSLFEESSVCNDCHKEKQRIELFVAGGSKVGVTCSVCRMRKRKSAFPTEICEELRERYVTIKREDFLATRKCKPLQILQPGEGLH